MKNRIPFAVIALALVTGLGYFVAGEKIDRQLCGVRNGKWASVDGVCIARTCLKMEAVDLGPTRLLPAKILARALQDQRCISNWVCQKAQPNLWRHGVQPREVTRKLPPILKETVLLRSVAPPNPAVKLTRQRRAAYFVRCASVNQVND